MTIGNTSNSPPSFSYNWEHVELSSICEGRQYFVTENRTLSVHHVEERLEDLEVESRGEHFPPEIKEPPSGEFLSCNVNALQLNGVIILKKKTKVF